MQTHTRPWMHANITQMHIQFIQLTRLYSFSSSVVCSLIHSSIKNVLKSKKTLTLFFTFTSCIQLLILDRCNLRCMRRTLLQCDEQITHDKSILNQNLHHMSSKMTILKALSSLFKAANIHIPVQYDNQID